MTSTYGIDLREGVPALETRDLKVFRGDETLVRSVSMSFPANRVVALIGPSGCGKTTLLKTLNRLNDLDPDVRVQGEVLLQGESLYGPGVDPVEVRRRIGIVFQQPNPFPTTVFENVAFGPKVNRFSGDLSGHVEGALRKAGLWEEVHDRLLDPAEGLSAGQKQRLCIARALSVNPEVLLMDEPASDLDPGATNRIEELIHELKREFTIVLVTHNMQQAARVSDFTAVLVGGKLLEYGPTSAIFTNPREKGTEAYITGRVS